MAKEPGIVRIVFEAPEETRYQLRLLSAQEGKDQKDILRELIEREAKSKGVPVRTPLIKESRASYDAKADATTDTGQG